MSGSAAPKPSSSSSFSDSFVKVDYPSYPVLAATASHQTPTAQPSYADPAAVAGNSGSGYGQYSAPQQQQSYSGYQAHGQQDSYGNHQQQPYSSPSTYSYQPQAAQAHSYAQPAPAQPSWQELHADNGRPYYYNASTGVTQWEQPAGFV